MRMYQHNHLISFLMNQIASRRRASNKTKISRDKIDMTQVRRNSIRGSSSNETQQPISILELGTTENKPISLQELSASVYEKLRLNSEGNKRKSSSNWNKTRLTSYEKLEQRNLQYKQLLSFKQNACKNREMFLMSYPNILTEPNMNKSYFLRSSDFNQTCSLKRKPVPNLKCYFNNINLRKNNDYHNKHINKNKSTVITNSIKPKYISEVGYITNPLLKLKLRADSKRKR